MKWFIAAFLMMFSLCGLNGETQARFPERLKIVTREDWDAKPPVAKMQKHKPAFITIHHTATKQNLNRSIEDKLRGLQAFSQREDKLASGKTKPAWPDVPYHFYIAVDGKVAEGRDLNYVGDTNTEYDPTGHLLVTLEGNFEQEEPTEAQMKATRELVRFLARRYKVPTDKIKSHKDYAQTACPGENLQALLPEIRKAVAPAGKRK